MAYLTVVINAPNDVVTQLNSIAQNPGKTHVELNALINLLAGINGGTRAASGYVVTRASDPVVTTDSDPNSQSNTFNHL